MPKTDKEAKIRGYRRKGNPWEGGVVDKNCCCKGGVCWIQVRLTKSNLEDRGS